MAKFQLPLSEMHRFLLCIQLFWERVSEIKHARIPKGIVGGFEFAVPQKNLKEWHERPWTVCLWVLKESNKSRFDRYSVRNSILIISYITFRDCRLHIFSDNLSRDSCNQLRDWQATRPHKYKKPCRKETSARRVCFCSAFVKVNSYGS